VVRSSLLVLACACSTKSAPPAPVVEDALRVAVVVDASPPDAPERFVVDRRDSSSDSVIEVSPRDASCPKLEYRPRHNMVRIERCRDRGLADQLDLLRDMAGHLRGLVGPPFEDVSVVGSGDYYSYPEFAARLAKYAQRVPYDPKKGLHAYIISATAAEDMAPELKVIFQRRAKLRSVEKCWASRPSSRDGGGEFLRAQGITGKASLPLGCSMAHWDLER
jgi:hypothetical protein